MLLGYQSPSASRPTERMMMCPRNRPGPPSKNLLISQFTPLTADTRCTAIKKVAPGDIRQEFASCQQKSDVLCQRCSLIFIAVYVIERSTAIHFVSFTSQGLVKRILCVIQNHSATPLQLRQHRCQLLPTHLPFPNHH